MICLAAGHNAKPIFSSYRSWFDICVMEEKQRGLIGLGRLKVIAFVSHGFEEEGDGAGLAIGDKPISLLPSARMKLGETYA